MRIIKLLSLIFLSFFLIFSGLVDLFSFHLHWMGDLILGGSAVVSGVLVLLSIHEFYEFDE